MRTYKITEKQLEKLKTITEKLKIDGLKAAIKSADEMSTYLEMHAETPEEKGLYESYLETWDNSHMQLEDIAENARELKFLAEDIENQPVEDTAIDKASYMFRRAENAELEAILIQASKNWEDVPSTSPRDCDARKEVLDAICDSVYVLIGLALKNGGRP